MYRSPIEHYGKTKLEDTPEEQRVLVGNAFRSEKKLLHRSPAIQQIIFDDHDYQLLSIGLNDIPGADQRIRYLEIAYAAPEELLVQSRIAVGVLGVERKYLDVMLKPRNISTTVKRTSVMKIGEFKIPPKSSSKHRLISDTLSNCPCKYQESHATKTARAAQCKKWRLYLEMGGVITSELSEMGSAHTIQPSLGPSSILRN
ncbi:hypothetical protein HUJ05_001741 [Dendroctonus ponderosae]|nr:hypothetical protein HUJ05_001741 [Dendroctonus ponderosae]